MGKPHIIFLDEPTTGLDPEGRLEVWKMVKELSSTGTTVFLTTQYLEEADTFLRVLAFLDIPADTDRLELASLVQPVFHGEFDPDNRTVLARFCRTWA